MKHENNIRLKEIIQELSEEKKNFQDKINKNLNRISEIDAYLNSIYEREDTDFKVFSPRSVENVYREQIERGKAEKYSIENENKYQYRQVNRLDRYLNHLQAVLENEESENEEMISIDSNQTHEETQIRVGTKNEDKQEEVLLGRDPVPVLANLEALDIQENDRQRIARDLHDSSLQDLTHLIHVVELSSMYIDQDPVRAKLELISVNQGLKNVISDIRDTIFDLRPMTFDDLGFADLLKDFAQKLQMQYKIPVNCEIEDIPAGSKTELITLYRVIKECCMNSIKHSNCNSLFLEVRSVIYEDACNDSDSAQNTEGKRSEILIRIQDDGIGFDADMNLDSNRKHYGLKIVQERIALLGGTIKIQSVCDKGTDIEIRVPVLYEEVKGV